MQSLSNGRLEWPVYFLIMLCLSCATQKVSIVYMQQSLLDTMLYCTYAWEEKSLISTTLCICLVKHKLSFFPNQESSIFETNTWNVAKLSFSVFMQKQGFAESLACGDRNYVTHGYTKQFLKPLLWGKRRRKCSDVCNIWAKTLNSGLKIFFWTGRVIFFISAGIGHVYSF